MDVLTFHLDGTPYALPLPAVAEVLAAPPLRSVPTGPAAVLGIAEVGGRIVAVLDLASLLGGPAASPAPRHLVRLAAPHERTALAVGGPLRTGAGTAAAGGRVLVAGIGHVLLDPGRVVARACGASRP